MPEEKKITITKDELVEAQTKAIEIMTIKNPMYLLLNDELCMQAALTTKLLFKEEK